MSPVADSKLPRYTVKHIDGVMHLTLQSESTKEGAPAAAIRSLPPTIEQED